MNPEKVAERVAAGWTEVGTQIVPSIGIRGFKRYIKEKSDKLDKSLLRVVELMDKKDLSDQERRNLVLAMRMTASDAEVIQEELDKMIEALGRISDAYDRGFTAR